MQPIPVCRLVFINTTFSPFNIFSVFLHNINPNKEHYGGTA